MSDRAAQLRALMKAKTKGDNTASSSSHVKALTGKEKLAYLKAKKEKELATQTKVMSSHTIKTASVSGNNVSHMSSHPVKQSRTIDISTLKRDIATTNIPTRISAPSSSSGVTMSGMRALSTYGYDDEDDDNDGTRNLPPDFFDATPAPVNASGAMSGQLPADFFDAAPAPVNASRAMSGQLPADFFDAAPAPVNASRAMSGQLPTDFFDAAPAPVSAPVNTGHDPSSVVSSSSSSIRSQPEKTSSSALPAGFFDDPMKQMVATGVDINEAMREKEKQENATLDAFLQTVGAMPSGYDEADGGGTSNNNSSGDVENNSDVLPDNELLEQGLQLAYESKVLGLREKSQHILAKRKGIDKDDQGDGEEREVEIDEVTSEKMKRELEGMTREVLHTIVDSTDINSYVDDVHYEDEYKGESLSGQQGSSSTRSSAIDFASVMLQKKKKKKTIADSSGLNITDGFMDWTAKSI